MNYCIESENQQHYTKNIFRHFVHHSFTLCYNYPYCCTIIYYGAMIYRFPLHYINRIMLANKISVWVRRRMNKKTVNSITGGETRISQ